MALTINHQTNDISATSGSVNVSSDLTVDTNTLYVDSTNNRVGIGTSSPETNYKLDVAGWGTFTHPSGDCVLKMQTGNTTGGSFLYFGDTADEDVGVVGYVHSSDHMYFRTNAAERMRLDASGNLLVGTTSSYGTNPKITVAGGVTISTNSSNYRNIYQSSDTNLYFNNGTNQAYLSSAGSWTNASDARLKTNIRNIEYGLNTVLATQPRHYERIDVNGTYIGFVAQELQDVIPEVVSGDPETQLGVDYGALVAVAFKAIQEQQAMIEALETRIAALESN